MPIDLWLAFAAASALLLAIPGPTVLLVVVYALGAGRARGAAMRPPLFWSRRRTRRASKGHIARIGLEGGPSVSVRIWRLRPVIFLPAS